MAVVKRPSEISHWYLPGILIGMSITFRHMVRNLRYTMLKSIAPGLAGTPTMLTLNYPEERYQYSSRFKGNHILTVKKDGSLRCMACMLCATNCLAECITIIAGEHDDPMVEKFPINYEIDILRCIFCGFCEEACPVDAIRLGPETQTPLALGTNMVWGADHLAYRPTLKGGVQSRVDDEQRREVGL